MAEKTKVTRIRAEDTRPKASKTVAKTSAKAKVSSSKKEPARQNKEKVSKVHKGKKNIFARIGGYFKGAWIELRQVRWPNRRATWGLTLAVIVFSIFFMLLITLLDTFFKWLFEIIIT